MTTAGQDWRSRRRPSSLRRWAAGPCIEPGCGRERFPGLARCYEHASKDALALLVEDAVRRGYKPGLLRVV